MSELIDNANRRKELLKHLLLQVHKGALPDAVRHQLERLLGEIPYEQVVEVEQELLADGLPAQEILKFCDIHTQVLKGNIQTAETRTVPAGHPLHTFRQENRALEWVLEQLGRLFSSLDKKGEEETVDELLDQIKVRFYELVDVEKHYSRKENLLFPFLESRGIKGPSTVMWAKDDEAREQLASGVEVLRRSDSLTAGELRGVKELVLDPALRGVEDMIYREEQVLFPMSLDALTESEWYSIHQQSPEIGFCLYDPGQEWSPESLQVLEDASPQETERIQLPSGSLSLTELDAILNTIPFDLTFVDRDDRVRYFTQGRERIFTRTRAILGRKVQLCHPPSSVHIVQQILDDFRAGRQSRAPFWINLKGNFVHIEYFALRNRQGEYLGTLEVSQDLTAKRALDGERRLLSYEAEE